MNKNLDVGEIIANYLDDNGFDGLYNPDVACACTKDDINPCCEIETGCIAGHFLESDCKEHDFHIGNKTDENNLPLYKCDGA